MLLTQRQSPGTQADFDRNGRAVPAQRLQLESLAHRARARRRAVVPAVPFMPGAAGCGNEALHGGAIHLLPTPAEHRNGLWVEIADHTFRIHDQHRVRRSLENGHIVLLGQHDSRFQWGELAVVPGNR